MSICSCVETNSVINAEFYGYVLHLRGVPTAQPLTDAAGNILLWNGEIFGGNINVCLFYVMQFFIIYIGS